LLWRKAAATRADEFAPRGNAAWTCRTTMLQRAIRLLSRADHLMFDAEAAALRHNEVKHDVAVPLPCCHDPSSWRNHSLLRDMISSLCGKEVLLRVVGSLLRVTAFMLRRDRTKLKQGDRVHVHDDLGWAHPLFFKVALEPAQRFV